MAPKITLKLNLQKKLEIMAYLETGNSIRQTAEKFGVPKSTVYDSKTNNKKMKQFVSASSSETSKIQVIMLKFIHSIILKFVLASKTRYRIKNAAYPEIEKAVYSWFLLQRSKHVPVTSELLREKAKFFYQQITGKNNFLASAGWLDKFKRRHGIRFLKICGERISSNDAAVQPFQQRFLKIVAEMELSSEQVYNADEFAIFWKVMPDSTWVHDKEKSAPGRKISKDRLTFMPCANTTGTHKLPFLVIGKSRHPRALRNVDIPIIYKATNKGWMTKDLFWQWFNDCFTPNVRKFLKEVNRPQKALLLLDNAPSHPNEEEVLNLNSDFKILLLPPNCTPLIQPMDQNLIQNIKVAYRKTLLHHIVSQENVDVIDTLKKFSIKDMAFQLDRAWQGITETNINKSWLPLWPEMGEEWEEEDLLPLTEFIKVQSDTVTSDLTEIKDSVSKLNSSLPDGDLEKWAKEHDELYTEELTDSSDVDSDSCSTNLVKHGDAVKSFSICIQWAEQNKKPLHEVLLLHKLKQDAEVQQSQSVR